MARSQSIGIRRRLNALLPPEELERLALDTRLLRRRRKLDPAALFWTLVLGFGTGRSRSLAALRRTYHRVTGTSLASSSFQERFTPALVRFLRAVLAELLERISSARPEVRGLLAPFADVVLADASVIALHHALASRFPGTRTNSSPAAAKLHLVHSVIGSGVTRATISDERTGERQALRIGPWVRGRLLIFDLGYFGYSLFERIARHDGLFLSRLSASANPRIVAEHRRWRGRTTRLVGKRLREVAGRLRREELDVEVEVEFKRRPYAGRRRKVTRRFRLIGVREPESGTYRFYLCNIAPQVLDARAIAQVYALRWLVEICQP